MMQERDDNLEIELGPAGGAAAAGEQPAPPPPEATAVEQPSGYPVVVITGAVRQWIEDYSRSDTTRERGGVLLGTISGPEEQAHVSIEAALEAVAARERAASITFTHETWEYINTVRDERYPHLRIVGWFHTHPGYSVFLSGYDLFIHKHFFTPPWQVAYVVDPIHNDRGFFGWRGEEIIKLPGYYVKGESALQPQLLPPIEMVKVRPRRPLLVWASLCVALLSLAAASRLGYSLHRLQAKYRDLSVQLQRAQDDRAAAQMDADAVRAQLARARRQPAPPLSEIHVPLLPGDTLWGVSQRYLGDPFRFPELQDYNRISDPKRIPAGSSLAIPLRLVDPKTAAAPSGGERTVTPQTGKEK